jgi:hypothetical protein
MNRGKIVRGYGNVVMSDGNGATNLTITLPCPVLVGSGNTVVQMNLKINTAWTVPAVQVIESTNLITFRQTFAMTDNQASEIEYTYEYEVA